MKGVTIKQESKVSTQKILMVLIFLIFSFSVLRYLPGMQITTDVWIGFLVIVLPYFICKKLLNPRTNFTSVERYALSLIILIPLMGSISAFFVFGQPLFYGLLSQRSIMLVGCAFIIYYYLKSGRVSVCEVEIAFKYLAWINLALCAPVIFLFDPNNYNPKQNFITDGGGIYNQFVLPMTFIIFGFFYYAVSGIRHRSMRLSLFSLPFLIYIVIGVSGRILIISVVLTYIIFILIWSAKKKLVINLLKFIIFMTLFLVLIQIIEPDKIPELMTKFYSAFIALVYSEEGSDPSANARIFQVATALPFILVNPLFGTGTISNQWGEGYKDIFGYFHPSDIGLLGVIFVFGIVGLIIFGYQIRMAWKIVGYLGPSKPIVNNVYYAVAAYLLYFFISSITTGALVFWVEHSLILMSILQFGQLYGNGAYNIPNNGNKY